jgi:hypothetical protein
MNEDQSTASAGARAHIQLFARSASSPVRWRLLGGNNRDIGRGALEYIDTEACLLGIKEVIYRLPELDAVVKRAPRNLWTWQLELRGVAVVLSAHTYDRRIRTHHAQLQFLESAPDAAISPVVMISGSRRWNSLAIRGGRAKCTDRLI